MFVLDGRWTPRKQGDLGELSAMEYFVAAGAQLWLPVLSSPDADLIADWGDRLEKVQVKTSTYRRNDRWNVAICTRGGNQSWNGIVKRLDASRCDSLFVHVGDGRRWHVPIGAVEGGSAISLGGPKYAAYEVAPGFRLPFRAQPGTAL